MTSTETDYHVNGVTLRAQTFGSPEHPAILLVHGAGASMLWWQTELCEMLAAAGRFVIRYDQRDTGRSTTYPVGRPGYTLADLTADAMGLLTALGIDQAHVVGRSMSGGIAVAAAVDHPSRVASVTLVSSTSGDLPMGELTTPAEPDLTDDNLVVPYFVEVMRAYAGRSTHLDEDATLALVRQDVARSRDIAAAFTNHFLIDFDAPRSGGLADIAVPTLVVQGEFDPVFPPAHGEALRDAIGDARLLVLKGSGHDVLEPVWNEFVDALVEHTAS